MRLQEGQRQQVLRVDIMGAVAGIVARRAEIDSLEQMISLGEWTAFDVEPILPVMPWQTGSLVRATTGLGRFLRGG